MIFEKMVMQQNYANTINGRWYCLLNVKPASRHGGISKAAFPRLYPAFIIGYKPNLRALALLIQVQVGISFRCPLRRPVNIKLPVLRGKSAQPVYITVEHAKSSSD